MGGGVVPEVGPKGLHMDKKQWIMVAAGGGAIGLWYLHKRNAAAAATTSPTTTAPDPNAIDPTTGQTYGSEGSGGGTSGFGAGMSPGANYSGGPTSLLDGSTFQQPSTNAAWVQDAVSYLSNLGQDSSTVLSALGAYTNGTAITPAQQNIVQQALAALGSTPTAVPPTRVTTAPSPSTRTITVAKGETQKMIDQAAGISYAELQALNPSLAKKGSKVHTGQKVIV
jgi:hypothetical protein